MCIIQPLRDSEGSSLPPPCASGNAVVANQFTNRQQ
eukprot:COSAG01_NODE_62466_length_284_cov_1.113514_1_plen_35_part_01